MFPFLIAAAIVSALAAVSDFRTGRIPNWLTLGAMLAGVLGHVAYGWQAVDWKAGLNQGAFSVAGLVFCSIAPGVLYWKGGMGGGDLKLFAAIGALCQPMLGIEVQMYALVVAAIAAPAKLAYEGRLFRVLGGALALLVNPFRAREKQRAMPSEAMTWFRLGPAIFAGTVVALLIHGYSMSPPG